MACHRPIKANGSTVPCGDCAACINTRRYAWATRLQIEEAACSNAFFITLTYAPDTMPFALESGEIIRGNGEIVKFSGAEFQNNQAILYKPDLQNFLKRYRKKLRKHHSETKYSPDLLTKKKVLKEPYSNFKYYAVGEYGEKTHRPHYHLIVFNIDLDLFLSSWNDEAGQLGLTHAGSVTPQSISYVTSYVINKKKYGKRKQYPPFAIMSKGIGSRYVNAASKVYHKAQFSTRCRLYGNRESTLPRYLRNKLAGCETADKILGWKNKVLAEKEIATQSIREIDGRQRKQRVVLARSKKSNI